MKPLLLVCLIGVVIAIFSQPSLILIIIFAIWLLAVSVIVFVLGWLIQFLNNFHSQNNLDHKQNRPKNNDE